MTTNAQTLGRCHIRKEQERRWPLNWVKDKLLLSRGSAVIGDDDLGYLAISEEL